MEHENIVKFYGICVEQNKVCTVYSHCPKGSLQDVLQNEKLNLDVMFQQSFITDMVKVSNQKIKMYRGGEVMLSLLQLASLFYFAISLSISRCSLQTKLFLNFNICYFYLF